jgi:hypothetical protein
MRYLLNTESAPSIGFLLDSVLNYKLSVSGSLAVAADSSCVSLEDVRVLSHGPLLSLSVLVLLSDCVQLIHVAVSTFMYDVVTMIELAEAKPCLRDKTCNTPFGEVFLVIVPSKVL